jgi:hypothetical protein
VTATVHLAISREVLISANDRMHHMEKARRTRAIRDMAHVMARFVRPAPMQRARCDVLVKWSKLSRKRDVANLHPTVKAAIDGIVGDYGLLPADDDDHLQGPFLTSSVDRHETAGVACYLTLTFTEVA